MSGHNQENCFFDSPIEYGLVFADGPVLCLSIHDGTELKSLYYHGRDEWNKFDQIGLNASPSRKQQEDFVKMWNSVQKELATITPNDMTTFKNEREIKSPWRKSQP